jgi:hypothetical protein
MNGPAYQIILSAAEMRGELRRDLIALVVLMAVASVIVAIQLLRERWTK